MCTCLPVITVQKPVRERERRTDRNLDKATFGFSGVRRRDDMQKLHYSQQFTDKTLILLIHESCVNFSINELITPIYAKNIVLDRGKAGKRAKPKCRVCRDHKLLTNSTRRL